MRKISITLLLLAVSSVLAWVYFANKFEQIAKNEILPKIKDNEHIISANTDLAIIEKFKFKITLKDVTIFPKSDIFKTFSEQVDLCYNPFNDKIIVSHGNGKLKTGSGRTEVYTVAEGYKIEFNRSLLNNEFEDINVVISSGEGTVYLASDNSLISHSKKSHISLISKLDKESFYNIGLKLNMAGAESNPDSKYTKYVMEDVVSQLAYTKEQNDINKRLEKFVEKFTECYAKILNKSGPIDYASEFSLKLEKKHIDNVVAAIRGEIEPNELYKNFSFTRDNYSLSLKENYGNAHIHDSIEYKVAGDGRTVKLDVQALLTKDYTDEQKKDISELLLEFVNSMASQSNQSFTQADLKGLFDKYLDTKKTNFLFKFDYDIASNNLNHSAELKVDNFEINANGALKDQKYEGDFKLATPKILISTISDLYDGGIKSLLEKNGVDVNNTNLIVEDIKNNGMEFLAAFDKKNALKEDESFESSLSLQELEFRVNDKGILRVLTDERVVKFLKAMPAAQPNVQPNAQPNNVQ